MEVSVIFNYVNFFLKFDWIKTLCSKSVSQIRNTTSGVQSITMTVYSPLYIKFLQISCNWKIIFYNSLVCPETLLSQLLFKHL